VFREVAMDALRMLDVPKDLPEGEGELLAAKDPSNDLYKAGLFAPPGQRPVSSVTPPPVQDDASASAESSSLDRRPFLTASAEMGGPRAPDFLGKSLRSVLEESAVTGFPVEVQGSGLARRQDPPPGTPLRPHALVRVQFGR